MNRIYKIKKNCAICNKSDLEKLVKLDKFPLTGIFLRKRKKINFPYFFNQNLNICRGCGHMQLSRFISPDLLYNNIYANRTSESFLSSNAISFFKKFLFKTMRKKKMDGFLEIGCNDVKLIDNVKQNFNYLFGIDPIWKKKRNPKIKKVKVIGDFVEKVNLKRINKKIDVVISTHNLEHIENPIEVLKKFLKNFDDNTTFFIEVPDSSLMIKNMRFDQIFHQHYHYFNINSLSNLINILGCRILSKDINYKFWGGSLMVAFKKSDKLIKKINNTYKKTKSNFKKNYNIFKNHYRRLSKKLEGRKNLIGYGAGQMVPSLAYHLKTDLSFIKYIVDDNKNRANYFYPYLKPQIKSFKEELIDDKIIITALDGASGISKKLKTLKKDYLNPLPR